MIYRNLTVEDVLPWTDDQMGWRRPMLDLSTAWVAEDNGKIIGLLIAADVHKTLLCLRLLGDKSNTHWIYPLWCHVSSACLYRGIVSFWSFMENERQEERRLARLMLYDCPVGRQQEWTCSVVAGRWEGTENDASTSWNPVACPTDNGDRSRGITSSNGVRTGKQRWKLQQREQRSSPSVPATAAGSTTGSATEDSLPSESAKRAILDRWFTSGECVQRSISDSGGSSFESQLHRTIAGER